MLLAGSSSGSADGDATMAQFRGPIFGTLTLDNNANRVVYLADNGNYKVRAIQIAPGKLR